MVSTAFKAEMASSAIQLATNKKSGRLRGKKGIRAKRNRLQEHRISFVFVFRWDRQAWHDLSLPYGNSGGVFDPACPFCYCSCILTVDASDSLVQQSRGTQELFHDPLE